MRPPLVGIVGNAGAGKDTIADHLIREHGFVRVSFADPMKRFVQEVFDFSDEQVWGTIDQKNAGDPRYPRPGLSGGAGVESEWMGHRVVTPCLSPRYALQTIGTEWGRDCYPGVWVEYALRVAKRVQAGGWLYSQRGGLRFMGETIPPRGVVISDCRFANEVEAVKRAGGAVVRVKRPGFEGAVGVAGHRSESEQKTIADSSLAAVFKNDGTIPDLLRKVDGWLGRA
jgi:hypothetical protein